MKKIEIPTKNEINLSTDKTPLQKVGSFLKEARQARNLTTTELANQLRIGEEQIIAIENGKENLLPERVFIKAMIKRISEKLDLDTIFILEEFNGRETLNTEIQIPVAREETRYRFTKLIPFMFVFSGLLGISCAIFLTNYIKSYKAPVTTEINQSSQLKDP